jgi:hypothetical protein
MVSPSDLAFVNFDLNLAEILLALPRAKSAGRQ